MRTFSLVEGTSDKFWNIDVDGASVTVNYGRTGTNGQTKTTEYESAEKARTESDKLIATKVKKGYVEGAGGGAIAPVAPTVKAAPKPATASAPAPEAPASEPSAPATPAEPVWTADELDLLFSPLERATLEPGPVELAPAAPLFDAAAQRDWVREHTMPGNDWYNDLVYAALPYDGAPNAAEATWWLRFGRKRQITSGTWTSVRIPSLRERFPYADKTAEGAGELGAPAGQYNLPPEVLVTSLLALTTPAEVFRALATPANVFDQDRAMVLPALRAFVVPLLDEAERTLAPELLPHPNWQVGVGVQEAEHALTRAVLFGDAGDVRAELEAYYAVSPDGPGMALVLAAVGVLPDPAERLAWLDRAEGKLTTAEHLRPYLLRTGKAGLARIQEKGFRDELAKPAQQALAFVLGGTVAGPGAVPVMLSLATDRNVAQVATAWLTAHPRALAASTAPVPPSQRDVLRAVVREVRAGDPDAYGADVANPTLAQILAELAEEDAMPTIGEDEAPQWLLDAAGVENETPLMGGPLKISPTVPAWADPEALPPLVVDGVRYDPLLTGGVLASALLGVNEETRAPRPLLAAVREHMRPKDRDALAIPLLQAFLTAGAKPADRAWFMVAGYLGSDGFVQALTPLVREWPGQSQHQRAVLGLEVLAATGTTSALQAISGIANKSKFKGVQAAARESLAKIAALQGLTMDQLEDRVVPDADLDARGTRDFSYGPRTFRVSLSPQGKAVIRDLDADGRPTGKPRTALPAPNAKDDAELSKEAKADFAVLRKQLTEVAKIQTARLERAIVTGRTWPADEHRTLLVEHPVLNSLIRPLAWRVSVDGAPVALVRATEDHAYVTVEEEDYAVPAGATFTLAHPLHLTEAERDAWRAHLLDYDLIAPLEQLDRATFTLPEGQSGTRLAGLPTGTINPGTLLSTLERHGWHRGNPADGGVVGYLYLAFEELGQAAVLEVRDGLWTGMIQESGDQRLEGLLLGPLEQVRNLWYVDDRGTTWFDWAGADPVLVSEVRRAVAALAEKMA